MSDRTFLTWPFFEDRHRALAADLLSWTAAHEKVPVIFVIINNKSYRILKQRTLALGDHSARTGTLVGMDLVDPTIDFVGMATSLGVQAVRVSTLEDFRAALAGAIRSSAPQLIDVAIDSGV